MGRIEADPAGLAATARALHDATAVAREVHRGTIRLAAAAAGTGNATLFEALDGFRSTWSYGLGLVVDDATTLARMLEQAATSYRSTDGAIAAGCGP